MGDVFNQSQNPLKLVWTEQGYHSLKPQNQWGPLFYKWNSQVKTRCAHPGFRAWFISFQNSRTSRQAAILVVVSSCVFCVCVVFFFFFCLQYCFLCHFSHLYRMCCLLAFFIFLSQFSSKWQHHTIAKSQRPQCQCRLAITSSLIFSG